MLGEIAFLVARRRLSRLPPPSTEATNRRSTTHAYRDWRKSELDAEFLNHFSPDIVRDKDVLDFGCGRGALSFLMARLGARSCIGMDILEDRIDIANSLIQDEAISFRHCSDATKIDLSDSSIDVVVCFDAMEHIMEYEAIMREWRRILRPGGKILIHWQPWFHPYGHHAQDYIPTPWAHVFLNERQRTEICARIVELPEFDAPWWDRDENGNRINRFRASLDAGSADDGQFLNKLTMWRFERLCREIGLSIERRSLTRFQGPLVVRQVSGLMSKVPGLREFFTASAIYVLSRNDGLATPAT